MEGKEHDPPNTGRKSTWQNSTPIYNENSQQIRNRKKKRTPLNLVKDPWRKLQLTPELMVTDSTHSLYDWEQSKNLHSHTSPSSMALDILASTIRQEKEIKGVQV